MTARAIGRIVLFTKESGETADLFASLRPFGKTSDADRILALQSEVAGLTLPQYPAVKRRKRGRVLDARLPAGELPQCMWGRNFLIYRGPV